MRWTTRDFVTLAVFGALWGMAEMTVGSLIHALRLPFAGLGVSTLGMLAALTGYGFVPRRGAVLVMGLVSALLKAFSIGSVVLGPMLAIVVEALLAESGLLLAGGRARRGPLMLAGALAVLWSFLHPFLTVGILGGEGLVEVAQRAARMGARVLGLDPQALALVLAALVVLHLVAGAVAGSLALDLGRQLTRRRHPGTEQA